MIIIVRQCALVGALVVGVHACATPLEIEDDVQRVNPDIFSDAGAQGGQGGSSGSGGGAAAQGGAAQGGAPQGGTGGVSSTVGGSSGLGGQSGSAGGSAAGTGAGTGGSGLGGSGLGGQGGAAGSGGGAGTGGTSGLGGSGSSGDFDPEACDFADPAGCEALTCQAACPTNDGNSCLNRCVAVIACVSSDACNITEADPLCGVRIGGDTSACTTQVETAGGNDPNAPIGNQPPVPSFVARQFVRCICSDPRP